MTRDISLMRAWLRNKGIEKVCQYVQRGRRLKEVPTPELKEDWVVAFRQWSVDFRNDPPIREDIEAELSIRGEEPPYDAANTEMDALSRAAAEVAGRLRGNAKLAQEVGSKIFDEMQEFVRDSKREQH